MKKQVTLYTCDRCGKQYEPMPHNTFTYVHDETGNHVHIMYNEKKPDLCSECIIEFATWWGKEYKPNTYVACEDNE